MKFKARAVDGKLILSDAVSRGLKKFEGQMVDVQIGESKRRTLDQNSLYWKRNEVLSDYTGYEKEEVHEIVMKRAGFGRFRSIGTEFFWTRKSSAGLDTKDFSKLMETQNELSRILSENNAIELPEG